jgi:hypothetical protein
LHAISRLLSNGTKSVYVIASDCSQKQWSCIDIKAFRRGIVADFIKWLPSSLSGFEESVATESLQAESCQAVEGKVSVLVSKRASLRRTKNGSR